MADIMALRWGIGKGSPEAATASGSTETAHIQALFGGAIAQINTIAGLQRASANVAQYQQSGRHGASQPGKKRRAAYI